MRVVSIALSFLLLWSCSIKEKRSECPCITYIDIDEYVKAGFYEATLSFSSNELQLRNEILLAQSQGGIIELTLPRRQVSNSIVSGIEACSISSNVIKAEEGLEFDPIWLSSKDLDCTADELYIKAVPAKQYCNMTLVVSSYEDEEYTNDLIIKAPCNGVDIYTLKPIEGTYYVKAKKVSNGVFLIRVPRQKDNNSLILEVRSEDDNLLQSLNLGQALEKVNYNWNETNLLDLSVLVDYSELGLEVKIEEWEDNNQNLVTEI